MLALITTSGTLFPESSSEIFKNLETQHFDRALKDALAARKIGCIPTMCTQCGSKTAMEIGDFTACLTCEHVVER